MDDRWMSVDEIAAYLGVSKDTDRTGDRGTWSRNRGHRRRL